PGVNAVRVAQRRSWSDRIRISRTENAPRMNELVLALFQTVQKLARSGFDFPQTLSFGVRVVMCPDIEYVNKYIQPAGSASSILGKKRRFMVDTLQHAFILVRGRAG